MRARLWIPAAGCLLAMMLATLSANAGAATPAPNPVLQKCVQDESKKDWDAAIADCTAAIVSGKLSKNDMFTAYAFRALGYFAKKNFDAMLADGTALISIAPNNSVGFFTRGNAYEGLGKPEQAIVEYTKVIAIDKYPDTYSRRGVLYANAGKYPEAKKDFETCLKLDPKQKNCRSSLDAVNGFIAQSQPHTLPSAALAWDKNGAIGWKGPGYYAQDDGGGYVGIGVFAGGFAAEADCIAAIQANVRRDDEFYSRYHCVYHSSKSEIEGDGNEFKEWKGSGYYSVLQLSDGSFMGLMTGPYSTEDQCKSDPMAGKDPSCIFYASDPTPDDK